MAELKTMTQAKNIALTPEFMQALHTFDLSVVRRTKTYRDMVSAAQGETKQIDDIAVKAMQEIKADFEADPVRAEGLKRTTALLAAQEARKAKSSLVDACGARQTSTPLYEKVRGSRLTSHPRTGELLTVKVPLNIPVFECSDVYSFLRDTLSEWNPDKLCLAPPFPAFWMEYSAAGNLFGAYFKSYSAKEYYERTPDWVKINPEANRALEQLLMGTRGVVTAEVFVLEQGAEVDCGLFLVATVDEHGILRSVDAYQRVGDIPEDYNALAKQYGYENVPKRWEVLVDEEICSCALEVLFPLLASFSYVGDQQNLYEIRPTRQQRRHAEREGKCAPYTYHILKVKVFEEFRKKYASREGGSHAAPRLHDVRANWAFYTPERPLFGKVVGMVWRSSHLRGNPERGVVEKDYEVVPGVCSA